jgi:hypothetical protein
VPGGCGTIGLMFLDWAAGGVLVCGAVACAGKLAEQAADRVARVGGYLKESDADRILRDVEDFGRQKPWAVALGGVALGRAAARFLKASSTQRYQQLRSDPSYRARRPLPAETATAETAPPRPDIPQQPRSPADPSA